MRAGILLRANGKGLEYQAAECWRNYKFHSELLVLDGNTRYPERPERYPGVLTVKWDTHRGHVLDEATVRDWLADLDVVFSVETVYDKRFPEWARDAKVGVVIQGNPEFVRREDYEVQPTWTWPTPWLIERLPLGDILPVPALRPEVSPAEDDGPFTVVHVCGHRAAKDRNGTDPMIQALRMITTETVVRLYSQNGDLPAVPRVPTHIHLEVSPFGVEDRWEMYERAHLLMMPRRYGGLCLPTIEALSCGMAVAMPRCSPNEIWPATLMLANRHRAVITRLGPIDTWLTHPQTIAGTIDELNRDRGLLAVRRKLGEEWAEENSWERLQGVYRATMASAADRAR